MLLESDRNRLIHMRQAARDAVELVGDCSREDFDEEKTLQLALVRCIEILGEAAGRVSPQLRALSPELPWQQMIRMRNRLVHAYFDINLGTVWRTVKDELPPLILALDAILK